MRDALGVVLHGSSQHIKLGLLDHWLVDDVLPAAEAHQHMRPHGMITLHRLSQLGPARKAYNIARHQSAPLIGGPKCWRTLAQKHAGEQPQMPDLSRGDP